MKVRLTIEISDCDRRYLRTRSGRPGLATRAEVADAVAEFFHADMSSREGCEDDGRYHHCFYAAEKK